MEEDLDDAGCLRKRIALAFDVGRKVCHQRPELRPLLPQTDHYLPPVMCYAVEAPEVRGKFDVQKAKALGVPPGPLCGANLRPCPSTDSFLVTLTAHAHAHTHTHARTHAHTRTQGN